MKNRILFLMATFALILPLKSKADLLVEPYLSQEIGVQVGKFSSTYLAGADFGGKTSGTGLGVRVGYTFPLVWTALDINMMSAGNATYDDSGFFSDVIKRNNYFIDVGVDLPFLIRGWFGYGFKDTYEFENSTGYSGKFEGTATKFGIGFKFIPFVSLNLEYVMHKYDKVSGSTFTGSFSDYFSKVENNALLVTVGIPLSL